MKGSGAVVTWSESHRASWGVTGLAWFAPPTVTRNAWLEKTVPLNINVIFLLSI